MRRLSHGFSSLKRGRDQIGKSRILQRFEREILAGNRGLRYFLCKGQRCSSSQACTLPFQQSQTLRFRSVPREGFATTSSISQGTVVRDTSVDLRTPVDVYVSEELRGIGMCVDEIEVEVRKLKDLGVSNLGVLQKLTESDWARSGCSERAVTALRIALRRSSSLPSPLTSALEGRAISMERSVSRSPSLKRDFA